MYAEWSLICYAPAKMIQDRNRNQNRNYNKRPPWQKREEEVAQLKKMVNQ